MRGRRVERWARATSARGSTVQSVMKGHKRGPFWSHTWLGRKTAAVNVAIVVALLLFLAWKTLFP